MDLDSILAPPPVNTDGMLEPDPMPRPDAADAAETVTLMDEPGAVIPQNVAQERARLMANWGLKTSVDSEVANPTETSPDNVRNYATRYNMSEPSDVEYGAYEMLRSTEADDDEPLVKNANEWKQVKRTAAEENLMTLGMAAREAAAGAQAGRAEQGALTVFGDEVQNLFTITTSQRLVNSIQTVIPEVGGWDRANVGAVVNKLQNRWVEMTKRDERGKNQAILEMNAVIKNLHEQSRSSFESDAQYADLVDRLTSTLTDLAEDPNAEITNKMNSFLGWAEALSLPVGGVLRSVVKTGRTLNAVRLAPNKGAFLLAQTRTGASRLWASIRNKEPDSKLIPRGAKIEDVIGSLTIPHVGNQKLDDIPALLTEYVPEADRAAVAADPAALFGTHMAPRVTGTKLDGRLIDGGVEGTVQFGTTKGKGFANQKSAEVWAKREFGTQVPFKVVNNGGKQWYVEATKVRQWGLDDINAKADNPLRPGYSWKQFFGKALRVNQDLNETSSIASREGDKVAAAMRQLTDPYWKMVAGSRARVADVLDKGDAERTIYSVDDLRGRFGLNDTEIVGYASIRRASDIQRSLENTRLWTKYTGKGYRGFTVNGHGPIGLKTISVADVTSQTGDQLKNVRAVDVGTGMKADLSNIPSTHEVVRFLHPLRTGERYGILAKSDMNKLGELPSEIVPNFPGYLPRPYKYPWYVKQFDENGVAQTLRPARSLEEAQQLADELKTSNPGADIQPIRAVETAESADGIDEIEALYEANLLYSNTRGPSRLVDVTNKTRMFTVEDRIRSLMADAAYSAGLGRWALAQEKLWNNTYGALLGTKLSLGMDLAKLKRSAKGEAIRHEAMNYAAFIQDTAGIGRWAKGLLSESLRNKMADWLYNQGTRASTKAYSKFAMMLGDNVSGLTSTIPATLKTSAYVAYLSSNPLRQLPLQMSLIPSYIGVRGATRYIGLGRYFQDTATILGEFLSPELSSRLSKESKELIEQWERSGIVESVDNHIFTIQTFGDGMSTGGGRLSQVGDALSSTHRLLKNVGINAGIYMDKMSAWLISRNRWQLMNKGKAIDTQAERQIAAWANDLNLNPDRSDILPVIQSGALSVFTQFLSQQVKMNGRLISMFSGAGAGPWTRAERLKMGGALFLTYGLSGFGMAGFARKLLSGPELAGLPAPVIQTVQDGFMNYGLNAWVNAYEEGDNKTDLAITDSYSPVNHVGGTLKAFQGLAEMVTTGDADLLMASNWNAPALGLTSSGYQVAKLAFMVAGLPDSEAAQADEWQKMQAIGMEFAKKIPASNNTIQMLAAIEYGKKFNARGNPQVEATYIEALSALFGVKTREELEARRLQLFSFPESYTGKKIETDVKEFARRNSQYLFPLWDQMAEGKLDPMEAQRLANQINMFAYTALPDEYKPLYINELQDLWKKGRGQNKMDSMVSLVINRLGSEQMPATADTVDFLKSLDISPSHRKVIEERIKLATATHKDDSE